MKSIRENWAINMIFTHLTTHLWIIAADGMVTLGVTASAGMALTEFVEILHEFALLWSHNGLLAAQGY